MWELNRVEKRALAVGVCLVGLATIGRSVAGPGPGEFAWDSAGGEAAPGAAPTPDRDGLRSVVETALLREQRALTPLAPGERIDPNAAPEEELRRLPGIGSALARALVQERARAPFRRPEDLLRVPGIGPVTLSRLEDHLRVESLEPASPAAPAGARSAPGGALAGPSACADGRLDVDRADEGALRSLPGIGEARARRIVERRSRHGPYRTLDALRAVPGIGARTVERLRGLACASGRPGR